MKINTKVMFFRFIKYRQ